MRRPLLRAALLATALLPAAGWAFDLAQLRTQLGAAPVVRGSFVQEKHLRALPQPLVSRGEFVLVAGRGLLWQLQSPLAHTLRITPQGVARRLPDGSWQAADAGSRDNGLFLALLAGDTQGLGESFDLRLEGSAADWRMVMTPSSAILRQIFTDIEIRGGALVQRIELRETQGDRTVLRMEGARADDTLSDDEQRAYTD
ncbi:outer membrane lipoprotein carrier protein LolA [Pseudothauera rhizosphaerae]|uniref:Outer membrane lipoprotein carrier protein LolA n=1 Tax=Pseudothauera rhizosphaerae TaxID=2565932 RepID=A0A4S4ATJ5_9RHOO|nr:outer membrane lipoprotein carrier protein LolA [Pseudothauera rhizosphaerae]THF62499.1 outer membrane lipoprotein carrier protein LolA [Pseudothauera rhizosphaerae]